MSGTSRLDFLTVTGQLTGGTEAPSRHFLPIGNSFWATRSGWDVIMVTANYRGVTWGRGGEGVALSILIEMYLNQFFWHQNGPTVIHISATRARPYVLEIGVSLEVPIPREELRQWGGGDVGGGGSRSRLPDWLIPVAGCLTWGIHVDQCAHTAFINVMGGQHGRIKASQTDYCRHITHLNWQTSFH